MGAVMTLCLIAKAIGFWVVWTAGLTAFIATPFWLVLCFAHLEWFNPFASEHGRAAIGALAAIWGVFVAATMVMGSAHKARGC